MGDDDGSIFFIACWLARASHAHGQAQGMRLKPSQNKSEGRRRLCVCDPLRAAAGRAERYVAVFALVAMAHTGGVAPHFDGMAS